MTPLVYDGFSSLLGGMNASVVPSLVPENQAASIINGVVRGGRVGNRPGIVQRSLTFDSLGTQAAFLGGNFQGVGYYTYPGDPERLIFAVAGRIYRATPQADNTFYVESFNPEADAGSNPFLDRVYMCQSDTWFIIQDGQSPAVLIHSNVVRRARLDQGEIPIGTIMAYGWGRTWLVIGSNSYLASNLIGESETAVIDFTANQYLNENSCFQTPPKFGAIMGMAFSDQQDTATGQGPLMVFGANGAESVNVTLPREKWLDSQIQVEALTNIGAQGFRSIVNVNGDLFFRSMDGWRSYKQARAEQGLWGNLPMSTGVRPYTDAEYKPQLLYGSAIFFNNRLLVTCLPQKANLYSVHGGLLSLDFDVISSTIGVSTQPPAWDGFWTTPRPVAQLVTGTFAGRPRAFAVTTALTFAADGSISSVVNGMAEIVEGRRFDDTSTPIVTTIETRAFSFNASFQEKDLERVEVFQAERSGDTSIASAYRNDGNPQWQPLTMARANENAPNVLAVSGSGIKDAPPLYTVDNRSSFPPPTGNDANTRLNRRFYRAQLQIKLTGSQKLDQVRIAAQPKDENMSGGPS